MFESIFSLSTTRLRHRDAPLFREREEYLLHMFRKGCSRKYLQKTATTLLHATQLLNLENPRSVSRAEIGEASARWAGREEFQRNGKGRKDCARDFAWHTTRWLRFYSLLLDVQPSPGPHDGILAKFREHLMLVRGFVPESIRVYTGRVRRFLEWLDDKKVEFKFVSLSDVQGFLDSLATCRWRPTSIKGVCQALRIFFRFSEAQALNDRDIARRICSPRVKQHQSAAKGPSWADVRRMIRTRAGSNPAELRTSAIIALCSIYALRTSEVVRLRLNDFDWNNETFIVHRSKSKRIQQFPIQYEVGEAILQYLQKCRPLCSCPNLFVTWRSPHRPMNTGCVQQVISKRMKGLNIKSRTFGPHCLRHACATRLLRNGSSLRDIADFLGHRGLDTVSVYAKPDPRTLRQVAALSLVGLQ